MTPYNHTLATLQCEPFVINEKINKKCSRDPGLQPQEDKGTLIVF